MKKILTFFIVFIISHCAFASENYTGPMRFSTFWPCNGSANFCGIRILAEGTIQPDSGEKFDLFLNNRKQHKHELPPTPTVVFNSPGGSIIGGIELGRIIRRNKFDVELGQSYWQVAKSNSMEEEILVEKPVCASACVIAFSGGVRRTVQPSAHMGIHQFSSSQGDIGDSATQVTVVFLAAYLEEMGINRAMLDKAS